MRIIDSKLAGVKLIEPTVFHDQRGFFFESYNEILYKGGGIQSDFIQDNHSLSVESGVLRGLHYQLYPKAQTKLVRVSSGAVYDVVVDIRRGSPTFGQWQGFILSAANKRQLLVPKGFAHGFCTLVPSCEVQYKVDALYSKEHDRGIAWNDPTLAIDWPAAEVIVSDKDASHPLLAEAEINMVYEG
ncbi:dTDP-4-dehydrorhamnose 3,5-epimerase [Paenibacillus baekrokdamisoli]|uniref:dTDP-4-dehydrorhamnose 3,5-epimerase n=1 Tax=Paenibacillus baekrokdamisoli TaxID=1712516 RepID=A0A3G9IV76_9BACL|nr:dTDP-4-dehydrorhamnose 3,5-epimerase [Paenibacillus baekrokdamisoli]MBB3068257.1 dTDP-4-dehydrorhamnose 3,5-epimerase [Paenibacillus baekrokdamisoli]BBH22700.1 dTDP-4-dehydrorhamnose 3,5-epimerase [Paenibacillus baekrokdamisoli]